jgi:dihydroorotate dehydrogenase electron transfer subunit
MGDNLPAVATVTKIRRLTPSSCHIRFDMGLSFRPGQFVMVWVPGSDEVPMALVETKGIIVQEVGDTTRTLCELSPGSRIGIRGPFGNGFPSCSNVLAVAGGVGVAPLFSVTGKGSVSRFLLGARTGGEIIGARYILSKTDLHIATDDGSRGLHGTVVDLVRKEDLGRYDAVFVCGPELMMAAVLQVLKEREYLGKGWFSVHRYMKCGVGVCGSCCMDPGGERVCRDGPVFSGMVLASSELGRHIRDASGRKRVYMV